jgi:hypothetical protein
VVEVSATTATGTPDSHQTANPESLQRTERGEHDNEHSKRSDRSAVQPAVDNDNPELQQRAERGRRGNRNAVQPAADNGNRAEARPAGRGGHQQSQSFADINVSAQAKRYIHIASLLLIFGSYLYLRLRKAQQDAAKS